MHAYTYIDKHIHDYYYQTSFVQTKIMQDCSVLPF